MNLFTKKNFSTERERERERERVRERERERGGGREREKWRERLHSFTYLTQNGFRVCFSRAVDEIKYVAVGPGECAYFGVIVYA